MKIKFRGKTLDIQNENIESPRKRFYTTWNYFEVDVSKYDNKYYESIVTSPLGEMLVARTLYKTMKEAVQDAFNNIKSII